MVGKLEGRYISMLKELAPSLGFKAFDNEKHGEGHYHPDLVWSKDNKTVGFEVECGKVAGKKIAGDAFWLSRTFNLGFIQVVDLKRLERYEKLVKYLDADFKRKVYVISTDLEAIGKILKTNCLVT